jgi:hypothetical protein
VAAVPSGPNWTPPPTIPIYDENRYALNTLIHIAVDVRILNEEIKRATAKLYQRIRKRDNPIIAALGNYDNICTTPIPDGSREYSNITNAGNLRVTH